MNPEGNKHATVSDYREFPVPALLANHFLCFWTQRIVGSGEYAHSVLPDCCIDIVFINDELPIVVGPWTDPFIAKPARFTDLQGARRPLFSKLRNAHRGFRISSTQANLFSYDL